MRHILIGLLLVVCVQGIQAQSTHTLDSTELTSKVVINGLDIPWEILWGPDDYIWVTERYGRVSRVNPSTGQQDVLLDLSSDVYQQSESGMLGMVLHPDFANTPHVFIAYTYLSGNSIRERMVKYNYDGTKLVALDTLIEDITGNTTHIGSRLMFLADNTLLMTTGDAQNQALPQNMTSVVGKILRLNLDGSIPADNPDPNSYVWSFGHRNSQGLCLAPNGLIYSSEHGPTTDDELNILAVNKNYGWPTVAGLCDTPPETAFCNANNVVEPIANWTPTIAPSDIAWYTNDAIPEFKDKLLMTVLKDKSLIAFGFNAAGDVVTSEKKYFKNDFGRLRDICFSPSGKIYLATNGSSWTNTSPFTHSIIELSNEGITTSIKDIDPLNLIKIGPNPVTVNQPLLLKLPEGEKGKLILFDILGRPIFRRQLESTNSIDLTFSEGVYVWKVMLDKGTYREGKLIIH